jgi:hypothetical protein
MSQPIRKINICHLDGSALQAGGAMPQLAVGRRWTHCKRCCGGGPAPRSTSSTSATLVMYNGTMQDKGRGPWQACCGASACLGSRCLSRAAAATQPRQPKQQLEGSLPGRACCTPAAPHPLLLPRRRPPCPR